MTTAQRITRLGSWAEDDRQDAIEQARSTPVAISDEVRDHAESYRRRVDFAVKMGINPYTGFSVEKASGFSSSPYHATYKVVYRCDDHCRTQRSGGYTITNVRNPRQQAEDEARKLNQELRRRTGIVCGTAPIRGQGLTVAEAIEQHGSRR
ncbi:MAG: hypothetical protein AAFX06_23925 [Planctomycetota bacterium]